MRKRMKPLKIGNLCASVPVVQGGMGVGISLSGLASAVASEGGIGVISSAGLGAIYNDRSKDYREASILGLKEELRKAREATRGIIGVNVMVAMSNFADMVRTAVAERADIIFSGAGLPLNLPSFLPEGAKNETGADRLVGTCGQVVVCKVVFRVSAHSRCDRGRGSESRRSSGV